MKTGAKIRHRPDNRTQQENGEKHRKIPSRRMLKERIQEVQRALNLAANRLANTHTNTNNITASTSTRWKIIAVQAKKNLILKDDFAENITLKPANNKINISITQNQTEFVIIRNTLTNNPVIGNSLNRINTARLNTINSTNNLLVASHNTA